MTTVPLTTKKDWTSDQEVRWCPGCGDYAILASVQQAFAGLGVAKENFAVISGIGCSSRFPYYMNTYGFHTIHGRAPAVATGLKRVRPDSIVFTYQGDGDLASIGIAEAIHAAHRGENITIVFVNNAIYGMTGGQMSPTTLLGQKTTTSTDGRTASQGLPLKISEMFATIPGATYIERVSVHNPQHVNKAKKALKKAFDIQNKKQGFTMIEFISTCPVNWGMTPRGAIDWAVDNMIPYYPLGVYKDKTAGDK